MINLVIHKSLKFQMKKIYLNNKSIAQSSFFYSLSGHKNIKIKVSTFNFKIINNCIVFIEHFLIRNKYINLVSKHTNKLLYKKHFVDSLTILSVFHSQWPNFNKRLCLDIGTGGGFPGLVLAIIFPQIFFFLLDSVKKKIDFHFKMASDLTLKNCIPFCIRVEFLSPIKDHSLNYSFILTRAVSEISILIKLTKMLLINSGKLIMMKSIKSINEELYHSLFMIYSNNSKFKSVYTTSVLKDGKIILVFRK